MVKKKVLFNIKTEDFMCSCVELDISEDTTFYVENTGHGFGFNYCIKGEILSTIPYSSFRNHVKSNVAGIWYLPENIKVHTKFLKGVHRWVEISSTNAFMKKMLDDDLIIEKEMQKNLLKKDIPYVKHSESINNSSLIIQQIACCNFEGILKDYYIQSKCIELFIEEISKFSPKKSIPVNNKKMEDAAKLVTENPDTPYTINEIAKYCNMSESNFKRSFAKKFNMPFFTFTQNFRMNHARKMLKTGELNVTEVAFKLGYSSSGNFSRAFHKHFGFPPKDAYKI